LPIIPLPIIPLPKFGSIPLILIEPMPIHCPINVAPLSAAEFEEIDYRVMGHAYASQNELGRLCDECAYEADLKMRLLGDGFSSVPVEVPVTVTFRDFTKKYVLDLVADNAVYELKAETQFVGQHEAQLLNYMFLLGIQRAKLLNFRPPKVEGKIVATSLTQAARHSFTAFTERWCDFSPACAKLQQTLLELLQDWGAFLETGLYQEALVHFLGGVSNVEQRVSLHRDKSHLASQRMLLHAHGTAFRITSLSESQNQTESHLQRLLSLTDLKAIQWINFNHSKIEFTTITR
jgi:GxxExxY protein